MKVKYTGPARDYSGYGEASRHDIGALVAAGVQVKTELPSYVRETAEFGRLGRLAVELESNNIGYEYQILHTTPDQFKRYKEDGKYQDRPGILGNRPLAPGFRRALQRPR
jgi:hypothetical protein